MKHKIAFILPNLEGGGAEKVTINYINCLDLDIFEVHLILLSKTGVFVDMIPSGVLVYNLNIKRTLYSFFALRKKLLKINPDLVFSTLFRMNILLSLILVTIKKSFKVLLRSPNSPKLLIENKQMDLIQKCLIGYSYKQADVIIAQTPEMKNEIHHYHRTDLEKIFVLLNPIDVKLRNLNQDELLSPFNNASINILAAGRLSPQKGFDFLIESFSILNKKSPLFHLHIIGKAEDKDYEDYLKKIVLENKLEGKITLHGFQANPYNYYRYCDLFVLSSRWEGMPNTVLENIYLKKPIIATKCIPFMSEIIEDGKNGFLVNVDDSVELSEAILNYKDINSEYSVSSKYSIDINRFFKNIFKK